MIKKISINWISVNWPPVLKTFTLVRFKFYFSSNLNYFLQNTLPLFSFHFILLSFFGEFGIFFKYLNCALMLQFNLPMMLHANWTTSCSYLSHLVARNSNFCSNFNLVQFYKSTFILTKIHALNQGFSTRGMRTPGGYASSLRGYMTCQILLIIFDLGVCKY